MACSIDSWVPTASITRVRPQPAGELLDPGHPGVAAFFDDVGRSVLARQPLSRLVAAHGDDPLGAELLGGQLLAQLGEPRAKCRSWRISSRASGRSSWSSW
jgi:hypothetical protein